MTRLAVVQPALALGEVDGNLARIEDLIRSAHAEHAPDAIIVPEAFSSPNVYAKVLLETALPVDGRAFQLVTRLARELDCVIGGGALSIRGAHTYGTYMLAEPSGAVHLHDKDIPSAWEHNYYRGGDDDGVTRCDALDATVGVMSGWEWGRMGTSARVRAGGANLVLGGMCWPSFPTNWPGPLGALCRHEHAKWVDQCRELPGQVARLVGAPVAYASHVGPITGDTPMAPGLSWPTTMIGQSQICDRDGTILARLSEEDGEGHVSADVELGPPQPLDDIRDRFWIPGMSVMTHLAWHGMKLHGDVKYRARHAKKGFPWQSVPAGDLPDEIPAGDPATAGMATS